MRLFKCSSCGTRFAIDLELAEELEDADEVVQCLKCQEDVDVSYDEAA